MGDNLRHMGTQSPRSPVVPGALFYVVGRPIDNDTNLEGIRIDFDLAIGNNLSKHVQLSILNAAIALLEKMKGSIAGADEASA